MFAALPNPALPNPTAPAQFPIATAASVRRIKLVPPILTVQVPSLIASVAFAPPPAPQILNARAVHLIAAPAHVFNAPLIRNAPAAHLIV